MYREKLRNVFLNGHTKLAYNYQVLSLEIKIHQDSVPLSHTILPILPHLYDLTILRKNLIFLPQKQAGVLKIDGE